MGWPVRRVAAIEVPDDGDGYHVGDDQHRGLYGGVARWSVSERELSLVLTDEALTILGTDAAGAFPLQVGAGEIDQVRRGLERVIPT